MKPQAAMEMIQIATITGSRIFRLFGSNTSALFGVTEFHIDFASGAGNHLASAPHIGVEFEKKFEAVRQGIQAANDRALVGNFKEVALA
jgi:hypothetical protein